MTFAHPDYTIVREIGRGSSAVVYLAVQHELNRRVALKVTSAAGAALNRARFRREALVLASLEHPNIVPVFALTELADGAGYLLAMRYLSGGTLRERLAGLALGDSLDIALQLADALAYAHGRGFLHRDVKPDNVLFDGPRAMLADFGIARATESQTRLTRTGAVLGTPAYMSPEQIGGARLDARSDLYSFGILLYEMLTGCRPYRSESALATGMMHVSVEPPPLPASLAAFQNCIDGLLAKNPDDRTADAATLSAQLNALRSDAGLPLDAKNSALRGAGFTPLWSAQETSPERRVLTVMCCRLDDFDKLSAATDPEDLRDLVTSFHRVAERAIVRYRGHVAQFTDGGLTAYFGFPSAHEDDARRAAHAGLDIAAALASAEPEPGRSIDLTAPRARIGVHTGPVVVGGGTPLRPERLAIGATPTVAARLAAAAPAGATLISDAARTLLQGAFVTSRYDVVGEPDRADMPPCYRIDGVVAESRYTAAQGLRHTEPVGRDDDIDWLREHWRLAAAGAGRAVCLSGEAGIGKSCIVNKIVREPAAADRRTLLYQCSPYHADSAFYPLVRQLQRAARYDPAAGAEHNLDRLIAALGLPDDEVADCAGLLNGPLADLQPALRARRPLQDLDAGQRRDRTLGLLSRLLFRAAEQQPVLLLLEDAHWIDPSTLALIESLLPQLARRRVLLLITARPEFAPGFFSDAAVYRRVVTRLADDAIARIVVKLAGVRPLPAELVGSIVGKAEGIPLYAEEVAKSVLDALPTAAPTDRTADVDRPQTIPVPATLHDSLMARLDRTRTVKPVAQAAACIGREFQRGPLAAALSMPAGELSAALTALADAGIIDAGAAADSDRFQFRHALLRDAAYSSLTRTRRREHHSRLLDYMTEADYPTELLAHHATEAGRYAEAFDYWEKAGTDAAASAAYAEAIRHLDRAAACSQRLPDSAESRLRALNVLVKKGHASTTLNGFAHPLTVQSNFAARALLDKVGQTPYRFPVLYGHWVICHALGDHPAAIVDAEKMSAEAERTGDRVQRLNAHRVTGASLTMTGRFDAAIDRFLAFDRLYDERRDARLARQYGTDPNVSARIYRALASICKGRVADARIQLDALETFARDLDHTHTLVHALAHLALTAQVGRLPQRERYIDETLRLVDQHQLLAYQGHAVGIHAMFLYEQEKFDESLARMTASLAIIDKTKTHIYSPLLYAYYSAALAAAGRAAEADAARARAIAMTASAHEVWALAEIHRTVAESVYRHLGDSDAAASGLQTAIDIATDQQAHLWHLRAATSLAGVWRDGGDSDRAVRCLRGALEHCPSARQRSAERVAASELLRRLR